jgi:hypothetical protein
VSRFNNFCSTNGFRNPLDPIDRAARQLNRQFFSAVTGGMEKHDQAMRNLTSDAWAKTVGAIPSDWINGADRLGHYSIRTPNSLPKIPTNLPAFPRLSSLAHPSDALFSHAMATLPHHFSTFG